MLAKPKREKDRGLLDAVKKLPCVVCGKKGSLWNPIDPSHIRSRGAGGPDAWWNVFPMCRYCHGKWHSYGWAKFLYRHPGFRERLLSVGWQLCFRVGRAWLWHPALSESAPWDAGEN